MKKKYYRRPISVEEKTKLEEIGSLIYQFRLDTQLSRRDFAFEYDIPHTVLERIENGGNYHFVSLLRVLDSLQLDLHTIMYGI